MKNLDYYQARALKTPSAVFQHFVETITANNRTWDYFINWKKVYANVDQFNIELNILNSLCDSNDFDSDLRTILSRYPEVVQAFPILIGIRDSQLSVLEKRTLPEFVFRDFDFRPSPFNENTIDDYVSFVSNSGLKSLFIKRSLSNLKDYSTGVEVGLDTNGRKNRGGTLMENLVQSLLEDVYHLGPRDYSSQASPSICKRLWGIELPVDKSSRRPDFLVQRNGKLYWIETNFYSGGGSKLKSTCGEYKALYDFCSTNEIEFIWITDGAGWQTTLKPLEETFLHNDYIFNLEMIKNGILNYVWGT